MNQAPHATATVMAAFDNPQQILASLGSIEGLHLLERGMSRLERSASGFGGRILDNSGWTVTLAFSTPHDAVAAARTMCQRIGQLPPVRQQRLALRICVATTPAAAEALLTQTPVSALLIAAEIEAAITHHDTLEHEEVAAETPLPSGYPSSFDRTIVGGSMALRYHDRTVILDDIERQISLGRGEDCGLMIASRVASRMHASIVKDGNLFALIDSSTNGTYISDADGNSHFVHKQVHFFSGRGEISLGQPNNVLDAELVHYEVLF